MATTYYNAKIFVGDGRIIEPGRVTIDGERITAAGPDSPDLPEGAIDLRGATLAPGLIDAHVHLVGDGSPDPNSIVIKAGIPELTLTAADHARRTLLAGVTTVRDMGSRDYVDLAIRDAVGTGRIQGARVVGSGRMVCMTGGHGWQVGGREADGPDEVRKAVREQLKAGVDVVKLMATGGVMTPGVEPGSAQFTEAELRAGIEEAHKGGRKTAAHAQGAQGILNAVRAGIDSVEHGLFLSDEIIEMMVEQGTALVPTLSAPANILKAGDGVGIPEFVLEKTRRVSEAHLDSLARAKAAGILIAAGTDAGTPFNRHGDNPNELVLLVENGFSPAEALIAGTSAAARVVGLDDRLGLIAEGYLADLVVFRNDPLEKIENLQGEGALRLILQAGQVVSPPEWMAD